MARLDYDYDAAMALMEAAGWDIYRLCSEAKIVPDTLRIWRRTGTTSRGTAASVACALGVSLDRLETQGDGGSGSEPTAAASGNSGADKPV